MIMISIHDTTTSLFHICFNQLKLTTLKTIANRVKIDDTNSTCTPPRQKETQVKFYKLSPDRTYHYNIAMN
jgi:hypothetical protein